MRPQDLARHWPLLPALALALALRLHDLLPGMFYGDPAEYAAVARSLAADWRDLAYPDLEHLGPAPFVSQPPLLLYLFALAIGLTGSVELGPLLVSALLGSATVAVVYALGTLAATRWTGAAAATFLALLPFHVRASREAQLDAGLAFFMALAVLAAVLWCRRPTERRALGLGLAVAAATFAKLPGLLVVPIVAVPIAYHLWTTRRSPLPARALARQAAIAAAPTAALLAVYTALLWSLGSTSNLLAKLTWQAGRVAGEGGLSRPWHWYLTEPDLGLAAQLGPLLLLALAGGAVAVAAAWRGPAPRTDTVALLAWPLLFLAFLTASARKEWFYAIPLNPALALLAAWPVGLALRWVRRAPQDTGLRPAAGRTWAFGAVALVVGAAAWVPMATTLDGPGGYGAGVREAAEWIHAEDPGAGQVGTTLGRFTLHLFNGQPTYHYWLNHTFVADAIAAGAVRYVVVDTYVPEPGEQAWLRRLVEANGGVLVLEQASEGAVRVQVYRVSPAPVA